MNTRLKIALSFAFAHAGSAGSDVNAPTEPGISPGGQTIIFFFPPFNLLTQFIRSKPNGLRGARGIFDSSGEAASNDAPHSTDEKA